MTLTYTCTMNCEKCRTTLRFEDERPDWKLYDYRVEESEECEKSAQFVVQWADTPIEETGYSPFQVGGKSGPPEYVWPDIDTQRWKLSIPAPRRYIPCPVCDAHVKAPR